MDAVRRRNLSLLAVAAVALGGWLAYRLAAPRQEPDPVSLEPPTPYFIHQLHELRQEDPGRRMLASRITRWCRDRDMPVRIRFRSETHGECMSAVVVPRWKTAQVVGAVCKDMAAETGHAFDIDIFDTYAVFASRRIGRAWIDGPKGTVHVLFDERLANQGRAFEPGKARPRDDP